MKQNQMMSNQWLRRVGALICAMALAAPGLAGTQRHFPSPQAAVDALVDSLARSDDAELRAVLGPDSGPLLTLDDLSAEDRYDFLAAWAKGHRVVAEGRARARLVLSDGWALPIPMVRSENGWAFDARAGHKEMQTRRIGRNELAAIASMRAFVEAQREYAALNPGGSSVPAFAQKIRSTPGQRDGLYWTTAPGEPQSPLGPLFDGQNLKGGYHGYNFRILKSQGPAAAGGAKNYLKGDRMTEGFALVGWPVQFGQTGVMTFIVNQDGKVFQKSLGPKSATIASSMTRFDPDASWQAVSVP
jgi:hypothetical protein